MPNSLSMHTVLHPPHKPQRCKHALFKTAWFFHWTILFLIGSVWILLSNYSLIKNKIYCISAFSLLVMEMPLALIEMWCDSLFKFRNWLARDLQGHDPSKCCLSNCPDTPPVGKPVFDYKHKVEICSFLRYWS